MSYPRILTAFTVPAGGWQLKVYLTSSGGADFDTPMTMTFPAGDYYMSGDNQSDDFMREFMKQFRDSALALGAPWSGYGDNWTLFFFNSTNEGKVHLDWTNPNVDHAADPIKFAWTELDGPEIAAVLGFDSSSDDIVGIAGGFDTGVMDADYLPGYQWVAYEDGYLAEHFLVDQEENKTLQAVSDSGVVRTQLIARRHTNILRLQHVVADLMFSDGVGYGEANVRPWVRNLGLECWWREAVRGKPFRIYRNFPRDLSAIETKAIAYVPSAGGATGTTFTTSVNFDTDPQVLAGMLLTAGEIHYYIESHTATVLTVPNAPINGLDLEDEIGSSYVFAFDGSYRTYVLDAAKMSAFRPTEVGRVDRYNIEIPLRRYVA